MQIVAITGSIATDHLMRFPGRFADQIVADKLATVSLSFLVDDLVVRRGGVAANIAYGMGQLGRRPVVVGAVGLDFAEYRAWLERHGVDCDHVQVSSSAHTARFVCTTDEVMCQIASFYPGAMREAASIDLAAVARRTGRPDLVVIGTDDPAAMLRHAATCRREGWRFAADPSQQLAIMPGEDVLECIRGAEYLLTNEYEAHLLASKTGLSQEALADLVDVRVTTLGERGVHITERGCAPRQVPAVVVSEPVDPTGVGDAFRAGFFTGLAWGLSLREAAQVGCLLAAYTLETDGAQEYVVEPDLFCARLAVTYGDADAIRVRDAWTGSSPRQTPDLVGGRHE
ncbi:carbohydrate kinase family protein [Micromonospora sp. NPDC047548]|uniref:carbohydrate kinase family protein n=1 Tax=Micromonospora sp. NPDC047548 TaxID=3155624 RepID=UPI0033E0C727